MNCCNEYGQCTQGHGCAVRCTPLITKQGGATITGCQTPADPERQDESLGVWESIFFWGCITLAGAASVAVLAGVAGYLWSAFAA